jgi:hypothetical protein
MRVLVRALLLGLVGVAALASAGDAPPPPPAAAPEAARPAEPAPLPAGDLEDFVPSEKVGADDAVAFPVDI